MRYKSKLEKLTRRYSDGGAQPPADPTPPPTPPVADPTTPPADPPTAPAAPNYEDLFKTDKALQSFIDGKITKGTQTALVKEREKMKLLNDAQADREQKLAVMSPEQRVEFLTAELEKTKRDYETRETGRIAKEKAVAIFEKEKVPLSLLELHDTANFNDEYTTKLLSAYSQYEFFPKGSFEKAVSEGIDKALQQKPPVGVVGNPNNDPDGWKSPTTPTQRQPWERFTNR